MKTKKRKTYGEYLGIVEKVAYTINTYGCPHEFASQFRGRCVEIEEAVMLENKVSSLDELRAKFKKPKNVMLERNSEELFTEFRKWLLSINETLVVV